MYYIIYSQSFLGGADYPIFGVSILVGRMVECGIRFFYFGRAPLGLFARLTYGGKSAGHQLAITSRLADLPTKVSYSWLVG